MSSERRSISLGRGAGASLLNVMFLGAQSLLFLVVTPLLIRQLTADEYGLWTIMIAVLSAASLANFGVSTAVVKYVAQFGFIVEKRDHLAASITFSLAFAIVMGVVGTIVLWMFASRLAELLAVDAVPVEVLTSALKLIGLALTPLLLTQVAKGVLLGFVRNGLAGGISLAQQVLLLAGALLISYVDGNLLDLAKWILVSNGLVTIAFALSAFLVVRPLGIRLHWDSGLNREILQFSFYSWIASIGNVLFASIDKLLVGIVAGPAAAGVYGVATGVAARLNLFAGAVTQVLNPITSNYREAGMDKQIQSVFVQGSRILAFLLAFVAVPLILWMEPILGLWIAPAFAEANTIYFQLLVACYALFSMQAAAYNMAYGIGKPIIPAIVGSASAILVLVSILIFGRQFGLYGVAVANYANLLTWLVVLEMARSIGLGPMSTTLKILGAPALILLSTVVIVVSLEWTWMKAAAMNFLAFGLLAGLLGGSGWCYLRVARDNLLGKRAKHASF